MLSIPSYIIGLFYRWWWKGWGCHLLMCALGWRSHLAQSESFQKSLQQTVQHPWQEMRSRRTLIACTSVPHTTSSQSQISSGSSALARNWVWHLPGLWRSTQLSCSVMRREPCSGLGLQHSPGMLKALQVLPPTYWRRRSLLELTPTWHHLDGSEDTDLHSG